MSPQPGFGNYGMLAKVVDASALAAIIFEEPRAAEAFNLIQGVELHAPRLLAYELTHVAQRKSRAYPARREAIEISLESALSMDVQWSEVDHVVVLRLALETGLTTYDASYLYVAQYLGLVLVTFDQRLQAVVNSGS
jgi:predicted nucleic acid-binding protein